MSDSNDKQHRIWLALSAIPEGKLVTYGQLAKLAGLPGYARYVGTQLKKLPHDTNLPWHRVVNAQRRSSFPPGSDSYNKQLQRLRLEGVDIKNGKIPQTFFLPS
ncbi:MGMT family protein [Agaribacterium haliotis]|uniref:MGMT family protein n=1 Tax=Agaribacterium haliotis TaxID=2013869 RepID=UPI000BB553D0|nr:MGMT family protein [Agaribacterium haliotis]